MKMLDFGAGAVARDAGTLLLPAQTGPLTTLSAIHALTNAAGQPAAPVSFEATVTYYRDYERTMFVQDGDAAIYVQATTGAQADAGRPHPGPRNDARELSPVRHEQRIELLGPRRHAPGRCPPPSTI